MWENSGWGLGGNGFYFFIKFNKNHSDENGFPEIGANLQASAKC
jgi:hypothetical protein